MAGATHEIVDPVETARQDIGSSKHLIAATLDDLRLHHSWLETYHRDERLRAERLRRRELRERLERSCRRIADETKHAASVSYVSGRRLARSSKRHAVAFARWAAPRIRTAARHTAKTGAELWAWTRRRAPEFTRRGTEAATQGFTWSVRASEEAGYVFRRQASAACAKASAAVMRQTAPMRRRGFCSWIRTRLGTRRQRARLDQFLSETVGRSQSLAQARKVLHRSTIRGRRIGARVVSKARAHVIRLESEISVRIVRIVAEIRLVLLSHMPASSGTTPQASSPANRALMLRPTTALACITPTGNQLPVPYRA